MIRSLTCLFPRMYLLRIQTAEPLQFSVQDRKVPYPRDVALRFAFRSAERRDSEAWRIRPLSPAQPLRRRTWNQFVDLPQSAQLRQPSRTQRIGQPYRSIPKFLMAAEPFRSIMTSPSNRETSPPFQAPFSIAFDHWIRIGDSISTLLVSEIEMPRPSIQRPGASIEVRTCHWSSPVRVASTV